ncbi:helix-turn-helix transcriptional regulator [Herbidospora galbida]|uniref:Helix-turn-helix transcriptional regulator n=1 Tax=Herbidospora galbida TaxID=2575442 RepID=A0A4U3M6M4_9ACTN|nr:helix-turn-helix transcriptional regulator [Herbidospora galbida]TKK83604.1 helix-turn-helix transcriptional regulator [Herbidospora galbida]
MTFGEKLRGYRHGAGKSLNVLARESSCSKSYLSRLESGERRPSPEVARHLDLLLNAGGALKAAARDDRERTANLVGPGRGVDEAAYGDALLRLRELGRRHSARMVLNMVRGMVADLDDDRVAAHLTEYASWMAQESGDSAEALNLITATATLARRGAARDLQAYALVRRAELLLADPRRSAELAAGIRGHRGVASRIRGLAALTEAKALALTGPARAAEAALDAGVVLLSRADADPGPFPVGPSTLADEAVAAGGWTMFDLGRTTDAVARLGAAIDGSPPDGHRARGLLGARLARAHLDLGDLEEAEAAVRTSLAMARRSGSASTLAELRLFGQDLRRWPGHPVADGLRAEVAAGLTAR